MSQNRVALMFPGQGAQHVGMGRAFYDHFEVAKQVFIEAEQASGLPLRRLCFEGPEEQLAETEVTQPAILTASIAALRGLEQLLEMPLPAVAAAGLSLGEYTALVAAGVISLSDAASLVRHRGRLMQEAVPLGVGAMAATIGLDGDTVAELCARATTGAGDLVEPANFNCPGQVVVSGHKPAVERFVELAQAAGARRTVLLPVSAPFHCRLMAPAQAQLAPLLEAVEMRDARSPIVANVDGVGRIRAEAIRAALLQQVTAPVRWEACVATMRSMVPELWLEIGPGSTLRGFLRRIDAGQTVLNIDDPDSALRAVAGIREAC